MAGAVHLDLSELVANPLRSGIQRIEREAIRHWPGPSPLVPCRVNADGSLWRLPDAVLGALCSEDTGADAAALAGLSAAGHALPDGAVRRFLNLELFFGAGRADAHLRLARSGVRVMWYVYDFLPYLRPDLFPPGTTVHCMHYLRALRGIGGQLAFLSARTRDDYASRVARLRSATPDSIGPVISPGADGLGLEQQSFTPGRRDFVCIGTLEPRKNAMALLRAFQLLWERGVDARLVVAGRLDPGAREVAQFFRRHAGYPRLTFLDQPSDTALRQALRWARALVMPSEAEGFGLPPYEALHAGIPAIASALLPSAALMPRGVLLLPRMDAEAMAAAVERLLDDATARSLWDAAADARLPVWADFGRALGEWAREG